MLIRMTPRTEDGANVPVENLKTASVGRAKAWVWALSILCLVLAARLAILISGTSGPARLGIVLDVLLVLSAVVVALVVPFSLLGIRSSIRDKAIEASVPGSLLVDGYRSPGMKANLKLVGRTERVPYLFTCAFSSEGVDIWGGGSTPKVALSLGREQVPSIRADLIRSGSNTFAAFVLSIRHPDHAVLDIDIPFSILRPGTAAFPVGREAVDSLVAQVNDMWGRSRA
jgi:hypothetical protein